MDLTAAIGGSDTSCLWLHPSQHLRILPVGSELEYFIPAIQTFPLTYHETPASRRLAPDEYGLAYRTGNGWKERSTSGHARKGNCD
jgi:hypothetical protein